MALKKYWIGSQGPFLYDDEQPNTGGSETLQSPLTIDGDDYKGAGNTLAGFDTSGRLVPIILEEEDSIPSSVFLQKGDLLVGTGDGQFSILPIGEPKQVLSVSSDPDSLTGLEWIHPSVA